MADALIRSDSPSIAATLPDVALLRLPQVLRLIPVARSTWWAGIKAGRFPAPVKLGPRSVAWRVSEIRALVERLTKEGA
jgi:predicted DNA-binding transcriptional regulator AlpA